jgi:glutaminyl-peptide cyclotransferase
MLLPKIESPLRGMACHAPTNRHAFTSRHARTLFALLPLLLLTGCRGHSQAVIPAQAESSSVPAVHSSFNGDEAYQMLVAQCDLGPRPPNTSAHDKCEALILKDLTPYVDKVITTPFTFRDNARNVTLHLTNIMGIINPTATKKIMLFTHWDTRPTADNDLEHKTWPIIGADDGASGTAVQLELAKLLHQKRPDVCVELLFVDGEDWGPGDDKMYLGAIHFANDPGPYRPDFAILLDMIGAKNLVIHREITSQGLHPELNDMVWNAADALGYAVNFPNDEKWQISDDHDSFNAVGIPAIDLIDFDYPYWHTMQDTADKCSPESLKIIGDVMAKIIYDQK